MEVFESGLDWCLQATCVMQKRTHTEEFVHPSASTLIFGWHPTYRDSDCQESSRKRLHVENEQFVYPSASP